MDGTEVLVEGIVLRGQVVTTAGLVSPRARAATAASTKRYSVT